MIMIKNADLSSVAPPEPPQAVCRGYRPMELGNLKQDHRQVPQESPDSRPGNSSKCDVPIVARAVNSTAIWLSFWFGKSAPFFAIACGRYDRRIRMRLVGKVLNELLDTMADPRERFGRRLQF